MGPQTPAGHILIADDQPDVLIALRLLLKAELYTVSEATSPDAVLAAVQKTAFDVVLIDLNYARNTTSGREGLDLLARLVQIDPALPVVVMTAYSSVEVIVQAMQRGARDFIEKPWGNERLLSIIRTQVELRRSLRRQRALEQENRLLRDQAAPPAPQIIARSPAMQALLEVVHRVGPSNAAVLITGENGTGKSLLARALHAASSRAGGPLVTVNAGGLSESLFESELFGHVKGAFTDARADRAGRFEMAEGGTLFLDEIANMPPGLQAKLLRVIETGEYERVGSSRTCRANVRLVTATNADLDQEVNAGRFRRDLLFRLNTIEIRLPPLRERREDLPLLAEHFLRQHVTHYRKPVQGFEPAALRAIDAYSWPGNVRELDHCIERAVLLCRGEAIAASDLALRGEGANGNGGQRALEQMSLEEVETYLIRRALARFNGNVSQAAEALGLSRSALYRRMGKYGL